MSVHGRESDVEAFDYFLARELGRFVSDIEAMPYPEYLGWASFFKVKAAREGMRRG